MAKKVVVQSRIFVSGYIVAAGILMSMTVMSCGLSSSNSVLPNHSPSSTSLAPVSSLTVTEGTLPNIDLTGYSTLGGFPILEGSDPSVMRANKLIYQLIVNSENQFKQNALAQPLPPPTSLAGIYQTGVEPGFISATTVTVSVLISLTARLVGGNDGDGWLSITIEMATGQIVGISSIFSNPETGLKVLAKAVQDSVLRNNACIRNATSAKDGFGSIALRGFASQVDNYKDFALTNTGLAVGFPNGQVGPDGCGKIETTVPYSLLKGYFSPLGNLLESGLK